MDMLGRFSRGRIAWNMGDYENTNLRNSKGASLVRQSKATLPRASSPPKPPKPAKKEVRSSAFLNHRKHQALSLYTLENAIQQ